MYQSFETTARPENGPPRLQLLRAAIRGAGLDGFLVPRADAHQGEYVAARDERLAWLTGFTGSAGFAAVTVDQAGVFVDGRYRLQVRRQVAMPPFSAVDWPETSLADWLKAALPQGDVVGYDPWLHTQSELDKLSTGLAGHGVTLRPQDNLVDQVWTDRPPPPQGAAMAWPDDLAGESAAAKRQRIAADLSAAGQAAAVLTLPDSIAWLLNLRGEDLPRIPVVQAFAILLADGSVDLFTEPAKLASLDGHLGPQVRIHPRGALPAALTALRGKVRVDRATAPSAVATLIGQGAGEVVWGADPCILLKARKNAAEIAATTEAHLRDGAAMCEFLCWLDHQTPGEALTEIAVVKALEGFRRATNALRDLSFDTICGSGPNGAVIHYRVTRDTDRALVPGDLVVVDSGAQYLDGTTDITRTVAIGQPGAEERACFTRVLQGLIALSRVRFPKGVAGAHLDALARTPLWLAGQDFDHGTGHGVGVFLSVHEGPAGISRLRDTPLEPGMILSNEPGYYRPGAFGIRIENLMLVVPAPALPGGDDQRIQYAFRTLSFAPIDRRLIDAAALTPAERAWVDDYHAAVRRHLLDRLKPETRPWFLAATTPLGG